MKKTPARKAVDSDIEVDYKTTIDLTDPDQAPFEEPVPLNFNHLPLPQKQATSLSLETLTVKQNNKPMPGTEAWQTIKEK